MASSNNIFNGTRSPRELGKFTLLRGVADFTNLQQFTLFESGYALLFVLEIPKFLEELAKQNDEYNKLITTYRHVLENEFRSLNGLDGLSSDASQITNGISEVDIITKVSRPMNGKFSMRYQEKAGSLFTKVHELFLRGIKDPATQVKRYHGLLDAQSGATPVIAETGYENEVFKFMYISTDNSMKKIEKAVLIANAQPTTASWDLYEYEKGNIEFKEIDVQFSGVPIISQDVNAAAQKYLDWFNKYYCVIETDFKYKAVENITTRE